MGYLGLLQLLYVFPGGLFLTLVQGAVTCLLRLFGLQSLLSWESGSLLVKPFPFVSSVSLFAVVSLVSPGINLLFNSSNIPSRIGAMYHVPFPVIARVSFGMWGCIPAILVRTFVALMVSFLRKFRLTISGLLSLQSKAVDISRTW
jgi:hypothetical protein